ncbi:MAG: hypothetical protein ACKE51_04665 [Methylococcaceae bacterium]
MGQIVSNAIITAIAVVDQVADARDIVTITKNLVWDKRYSEIVVWFALVLVITLIVSGLLKPALKEFS